MVRLMEARSPSLFRPVPKQLHDVVVDLAEMEHDPFQLLAGDVLELHQIHGPEDLVLDLLGCGQDLVDGLLNRRVLGPGLLHDFGDECLLAVHQLADQIELIHHLVGFAFRDGSDGVDLGDDPALHLMPPQRAGSGWNRRGRLGAGGLQQSIDFRLVHSFPRYLLSRAGTRSFLSAFQG